MPKTRKRVPFYERIRTLRESRGLSYRRMSAELQENYGIKVSATALQKWEMERETSRLPGRDKISALCKLFNVSPSFLLDEIFSGEHLEQDRLSQFSDIEMLTDEDFAALLQIKDSLATRSPKQRHTNGQ